MQSLSKKSDSIQLLLLYYGMIQNISLLNTVTKIQFVPGRPILTAKISLSIV